jgi:tRNA (cytosine34-C5)-methyltransferase
MYHSYYHRCYYALQGLHDTYWKEEEEEEEEDGNSNTNLLVECPNDESKTKERQKWRNCISQVLPSSFRFNYDLPKPLIDQLEQELHTLLQQCCTAHRTTDDDIDNNKDYKTEIPQRNTDSKNEDDEVATNQEINVAETIKNDTSSSLSDRNDSNSNNNRNNKNKVYDTLPTNPNAIMKRLEFLPHAYQLKFDKYMIRKHPSLLRLHDWLIQQTNIGYITRQETVSMIPPVVLQPQPTDFVLDMCAAPGSKTSQILEQLQNGGCIIANDNNPQRAYMLTHQLKRINYTNPVVLVTCVDAQHFPSRSILMNNESNQPKQFDTILCDVPCTGDGTTRKNINVWKSWSCMGAIALHTLQYQILHKGITQLLKVNGTICYSTCSLNPIENEAVIAEMIRQSNGTIELVDCHALFDHNNFKIRPGMTSWKVLIEQKSKKQMKNERNKNNTKMQTKRLLYQNKDDNDDGILKPEDQETIKDSMENSNNNKEDGNSTTVLDNDEIDDYTLDQQRTFGQKFEPTTFDETILLDTATNVCGLRYYRSYEEVLATAANENNNTGTVEEKRIKQSCFPPTPEEVANFHLERCIRCYPHDNDTGGFFVALLRKIAPMSSIDRKKVKNEPNPDENCSNNIVYDNLKRPNPIDPDDEHENDHDESSGPNVKRQRIEPHDNDNEDIKEQEDENDDDIIMNKRSMKSNLLDGSIHIGNDDCVPISDDIMNPLIEYYGLDSATFPRQQYMARACATEIKVIYFISQPIKQLIDYGIQKRITGMYNSVFLTCFVSSYMFAFVFPFNRICFSRVIISFFFHCE